MKTIAKTDLLIILRLANARHKRPEKCAVSKGWLAPGWVAGICLLSYSLPGHTAKIYVYSQKDGKVMITDAPDFSTSNELIKSYRPVAPIRALPSPNTYRSQKAHVKHTAYDELISRASRHYQQDPKLIKSIIQVESNFNPDAVSPKGALGLMQLMPATASRYEVDDPFDAEDNLSGGIQYFSDLMQRYNDNIQLALAAYNAGERAVDEHKNIPPFPETQAYVKNVIRLHREYQKKH